MLPRPKNFNQGIVMTAVARKEAIPADQVGGVSGAKLKAFIERIERMEE